MEEMSSLRGARNKSDSANGTTLVEMLLALTIIGLLAGAVVLVVHPFEQARRGRDNRRLGDLLLLVSAIERYVVDHAGTPPDISGALRTSLDAAPGAYPSDANGQGWIASDLTVYAEALPIDPLNDRTYYYRYKRVGVQYELDARLESGQDRIGQEDGGNNATRFEQGSNTTLLD